MLYVQMTWPSRLFSDHIPHLINRHFISIMAASRHSCPELISHHSAMLQDKIMTMAAATDPAVEAWLKSGFRLADANQKYRTLDNVNRIMAHKPWMLTKNHIMDLTRLVEGEDGNQRWIITQVGQAITLIAHIHSFSSFVFSLDKVSLFSEISKTSSVDVIFEV